MGRTVWVIAANAVVMVVLLRLAVDVSFNGAAANVLADLMVVGMITVAARSWLLRIRRASFGMSVERLKQRAETAIDDWVVAQREKHDQYRHLAGDPGHEVAQHVSYRAKWDAAREVLHALERATEDQDVLQAAHDVGFAEQAAKDQRKRLHTALDPILRSWLEEIPDADDVAGRGKLASQVGVAGWSTEAIRDKEAQLVAAYRLRPLVDEYLADERQVRGRLEFLKKCVAGLSAAKIVAQRIPARLPRTVERVGLVAAVVSAAIWAVVAAVAVIGVGNLGEFFFDVLNNLLCAAAVVAAGAAISTLVSHHTKKRQAEEAIAPCEGIHAALSRARNVLTDIVHRDEGIFFVASNGDAEQGSVEHRVTTADAEELRKDLDAVRRCVLELQRIRPTQELAWFENLLSDYVRRFAPDSGSVPIPENLLDMATYLVDDMRQGVSDAFPDVPGPREPADEARGPVGTFSGASQQEGRH